MNTKLSRGAQIIAYQWLQVEPNESLLIVTSEQYKEPMEEIKRFAQLKYVSVDMKVFPDTKNQIGHYYDEHENAFDAYDVILGATKHSIVTTKAVKRAIQNKKRFLSLPMATNDDRFMLEYEFLLMDPAKSKEMARKLIPVLNEAQTVRITTELGTQLEFSKQGRDAKYFIGATRDSGGYASSSFEVYIPILENKTNGVAYIDGSLGYIGEPKHPIRIDLKDGRIIAIDTTEQGKQFSEYLQEFQDKRMYVAGELGIGLNLYSRCTGNCYIEDESCYGTFHSGFGRNIALGGTHEAKAHFDLVFHRPNIYADDVLVMEQGEIVDYYKSEFVS